MIFGIISDKQSWLKSNLYFCNKYDKHEKTPDSIVLPIIAISFIETPKKQINRTNLDKMDFKLRFLIT